MRIHEIEIYNILGTKQHNFRLGDLTVIRGHNGSGKSSIISGILSVFEGGHDPGLLHRGAKKGWVKLLLGDGATITKSVTAKASTVEALDPKGHVIPKPQAFINELAEAMAVEPARLLLAKQKDLLSVLLDVMPVTFTREETEKAAGRVVTSKSLDLDGLAALRKQIFDERTAVNKAARDSEGTVNDLRRNLPEQDEIDWGAEAQRLRDELAAGVEEVNEVKRSVESEAAKAEQSIVNEINEKVAALMQEKATRIAAVRKDLEDAKQRVDQQAAPVLDKLKADAATAQERSSAQAKATGIRESIAKFEARIRENEERAEKLTAAIQALDDLKKAKLDTLPIPGLEVADGKLLVDGIEWSHVNLARRVEITFAIWDLRNAPFAVLDDAEHFDAEMWQAFCDYCLSTKRQVIAARVGDGPLEIEAIEAGETVPA